MRELKTLGIDHVSGGDAPLRMPVVVVTGQRQYRPWEGTGQTPNEYYGLASSDPTFGEEVASIDDGPSHVQEFNPNASLVGLNELIVGPDGNVYGMIVTPTQTGYADVNQSGDYSDGEPRFVAGQPTVVTIAEATGNPLAVATTMQGAAAIMHNLYASGQGRG